MTLQIEDTTEQNVKLCLALVKAVGELSNVAKTAANPYFKSKYAPLDAIIDATRPVLEKHGLAVIQEPLFLDGTAGVETIIIHKDGGTKSSTLLLPLKDQSPQGVGSAITYARRYALAAVLGIASEDDDDGNVSTGLVKKQETKAVAKESPAKESRIKEPNVATHNWRNVEITNIREIAFDKGVFYAIEFDGKAEALTFDKKLAETAKEIALEKVDAGVSPSKKDPSKWKLISIAPTSGATANITPDEKA
jgi:hypothetical protein